MKINDKTIKALATSLNFRQMRQKIISSNIANADTPDYKAKRVDFEDALERALNLDKQNGLVVGDKQHFDVGAGGFNNLEPEIYEDPNGIVSEDGNTVNRDEEMAKMAENEILYDTSIQLLNKKLALKKYILSSEK